MNLSHRPLMTLSEYCAKCARCPFKDMTAECKRGQKLKVMPCCAPKPMTIKDMLEEDRELLGRL